MQIIKKALGIGGYMYSPKAIYGARGTVITPRWREHPVPEDQFTHGQGRGPLGTGIGNLMFFGG